MAGGSFYSTKLKRKDLEEVQDEFSDFSLSSPARKIRRLDAELPPIMEDEPEMPVDFEESSPVNYFAGGVDQVRGPIIEELPSDLVNEERAIVLFKPLNNTLQSLSNFSVSSDIISGFKNQLKSSQCRRTKPWEDEDVVQDSTNECLAVVPWIPSQVPIAMGQEVSQTDGPVSMEAEETGETAMDIEDNNLSLEQGQAMANDLDRIRGSEGLHQWHQQHCMTPQLPQNTSTPIVWYR